MRPVTRLAGRTQRGKSDNPQSSSAAINGRTPFSRPLSSSRSFSLAYRGSRIFQNSKFAFCSAGQSSEASICSYESNQPSPASAKGMPLILGERGEVQLFMFPWSSTRLKGGFESKFFRGHRLPDCAAEGTAALQRRLHSLQLRLRLRPVHLQHPLSRPLYRPLRQGRHIFRHFGAPPAPQTRPSPILRTFDQPRTQGVPLHVTQNRKQVFVSFHWKRLVCSLIKVPAANRLAVQVPTGHAPPSTAA